MSDKEVGDAGILITAGPFDGVTKLINQRDEAQGEIKWVNDQMRQLAREISDTRVLAAQAQAEVDRLTRCLRINEETFARNEAEITALRTKLAELEHEHDLVLAFLADASPKSKQAWQRNADEIAALQAEIKRLTSGEDRRELLSKYNGAVEACDILRKEITALRTKLAEAQTSQSILNQLKEWWQHGAHIYVTDRENPFLTKDDSDNFIGNLTIDMNAKWLTANREGK